MLLNMTNSLNMTAITSTITFLFIDQPVVLFGGVVVIIILAYLVHRKSKPKQTL